MTARELGSRRPAAGPIASLCLVLSLGACEGKKDPPVPVASARSQGVLAAPGSSASTGQKNALAQAEPSQPAPANEPLCSPAEVTDLPKQAVSGLGTAASPFAGGPLPLGRATWITLWAAWCEPCKKELPLLLEWKQRLAAEGKPIELVFLSLDDDERQLSAFLAQHPELGSTYWLREGQEREKFMTAVGLAADPRLPVQLLVSRSGAVSCRIDGAVEAGDYSRVREVVSRL
jgi:thiol-disulfide isomerase/thioredoxin